MKGPPEWPREVHRSGLEKGPPGLAKGVVERAAGDLRAVEHAVGHLSADESAAGHLDVNERDAGDLNAVETCCLPLGARSLVVDVRSPCCPGGER